MRRKRMMIERLEQRRLLSGCCAGSMSDGMSRAAVKEMADQLASQYHQSAAPIHQGHALAASGHGDMGTGQMGMGHAGGHGVVPDGAGKGAGHKPMSMTQSVALRRGTLLVRGSHDDDVVTITRNADDSTKVDVVLNGVTQSFTVSDVKRIRVMTGRGNDTVAIDPSLNIPGTVNGRRGR